MILSSAGEYVDHYITSQIKFKFKMQLKGALNSINLVTCARQWCSD